MIIIKKMDKIEATVIIAVYNRPEVLKLTLEAYKNQTFKNFELIIADDGSKENIKDIVESFKKDVKFYIKYLWQEDVGFRKNKILNEAIKSASSDYLIFADFDCIPHCQFVYDHIINKQTGRFLVGRRVELGEKLSQKMSAEDIHNKVFENFGSKWFKMIFSKDTKYFELGVRVPFGFLNKILHPKPVPLLGHNFSIFKNDLYRINGFNEDYDEVGVGEDIDLEFRLLKASFLPKNLIGMAIQYHYYHKVLLRSQKCYNLFEETKKRNEFFCKNGLNRKI